MIIIKIGGTKGININNICLDVANILQGNESLILVHGGSEETNLLAEKIGYPPKFITSPSGFTSRYTDQTTLELFIMAVNGKINTLLVQTLQNLGVNAVGVSGLDGKLFIASRKKSVQSIENGKRKIIHDDYTGKVERVNPEILEILLNARFIPVIAPLAISYDGEVLNIDADRAAAMLAGTMKADVLIYLTGAPGLLKNYPDENSLIPQLRKEELEQALGFAQGRMKKKVLAASEAFHGGGGVEKIVIADGRAENPILDALNGIGTVIT